MLVLERHRDHRASVASALADRLAPPQRFVRGRGVEPDRGVAGIAHRRERGLTRRPDQPHRRAVGGHDVEQVFGEAGRGVLDRTAQVEELAVGA